jgi:GTP cyclohydrolase I
VSHHSHHRVRCKLCNKKFERITNTHLREKHDISMRRYQKKFPNSPIESEYLVSTRGRHTRGHTYEEIHGSKKAKDLKRIRRIAANEQFTDDDQREIRRDRHGFRMPKSARKKLAKLRTVHGGTTYRKRALKHYGTKCMRCGYKPEDGDESVMHVHHRDGININSELGDHSLENLIVLCHPCHVKLHNEQARASAKFFGIKAIEKGVHYIFKGLKKAYGLNLNDDNFRNTPKRVARAYAEIFEGVKHTDNQVKEILSTGFPCRSSEMILVRGIRAFSMCPHHLLPVDYTVTVAYLPSRKEKGKVLGLSKLTRLVQVLGRRPVLQEQFVCDVAEALMKLRGCMGAACLANGRHYCMIMRGVNQPDSFCTASSLRGSFKDNPTRAEFLSLAMNPANRLEANCGD